MNWTLVLRCMFDGKLVRDSCHATKKLRDTLDAEPIDEISTADQAGRRAAR